MYHKSCRSSFENPPEKHPGALLLKGEMSAFLSVCQKFENEMEVYTLTEFHEAMTKPGTEVYSLKMTKEKRKGNMKLLFDLFKGETEVI